MSELQAWKPTWAVFKVRSTYVAGVALIYPPAAVILAGAIAVAAAFALERGDRG